MRITVFGAAGKAGSRIVTEAIDRGHQVTAVVRRQERFAELDPRARAAVGDASNRDDVLKLSRGQDLVVTSTRAPEGSENLLVGVTQNLLHSLEQTATRLILVGGAASLIVPDSGGVLVVDDPNYIPDAWKAIALACQEQHQLCIANSTVDWTYISPPAQFIPGERTGSYRLGRDELLIDNDGNSKISMEDFAIALVDEAERPEHSRQRFTLAY